MDSVSSALYTNSHSLSLLQNLRTMTIDFAAEGEATHHTSARLILSSVTSSLTQLELLYLPSITPRLLSLIASHCPNLCTLILCCSDRLLPDCCWNCYDDAGDGAVHSPIPDAYCNAKHLAHAFGKELVPLRRLTHLHLGIYLSPLDLFKDHLDHAGDFRFPPPADAIPPFGPDDCADCQGAAEATRRAELLGAATLASYLPALETVTWSTFFAQSSKAGDDPANQMTTIAIYRDE